MSFKPQHSLLLILLVGGVLGVLSLFFPSTGIKLTDSMVLTMPQVDQLLFEPTANDSGKFANETVEEFLEIFTVEIDSLMLIDSLSNEDIEVIKKQQNSLKIQYPENNLAVMSSFFEALELVGRYPARILHYGDSQIEGDRMTGYIRNEFQKQFGGSGCGLVPIFETFPTFAINQSDSDNWKRHAAYFTKNKKPKHQRFGVLANYSRFNEAVADSLVDSLPYTTAWIRFAPNKKTYQRAGKFNRVKLLFGYNRKPVVAKIITDDELVIVDTLPANESSQTVIWPLASFPQDLKVEFEGQDSPDIYGISLETSQGVLMDNIGMRGSSGTFFSKLERNLLQAHFAELEPNLIILQYGGNTVPSIHSSQKAKEYGSWFAAQIRLLQRMNPSASFIVVGPSDMSASIDGVLQTRKYLEDVRDALRQAAFDSGAGFWDLYEVMGGRNSMISWVEADPPLAANDYTHFAPGGAKKLSKLFYKALMDDYNEWKEQVP